MCKALRKIAYENDALTEYEKLHPPTPRRSAGPSGMPGIDGMAGMMFKSMDKNADGMLSREELASLIVRRIPRTAHPICRPQRVLMGQVLVLCEIINHTRMMVLILLPFKLPASHGSLRLSSFIP